MRISCEWHFLLSGSSQFFVVAMRFAANLFKLYLLAASFQQTRAQITAVANDSELWRLSIDFLTAFNAQQPIKRLIALFGDSAKNGKNKISSIVKLLYYITKRQLVF
jgi:hypothetical protein